MKQKTMIKKWLEKNNIKQDVFAHNCSTSLGFMNNLVNGKYTCIRIDLLNRISSVTGIEHAKLIKDLLSFGGEQDEKGSKS